jgi:proline iminopeptidase
MREEIGYIQIGEFELYLEDIGPEEAPVIAFLHGGPGGSAYAFREGVGDDLEDYRVLYFDQRGSGRSPELPAEPRLFTIDALVEDLEALRRELGIAEWTLLSHGFGAVVALEYTRKNPQRVDGLILVAPWVNYPELARRLFRSALALRGVPDAEAPTDPMLALAEAFRETEPKAVFDALMFPSEHSRLEYEWLAEGSGILGNEGPGQMFVYNGLWNLDYTAYLFDLPLTPAVIVGAKDGTSYPEQAEWVADLTGGSLEVLEGAGHYPWMDEPEAFREALYHALDSLEP